jgi:beta-lactam-binding protein with PASTA domain
MTFAQARLLLVSDGFTVVGKHTRVGQIVKRTNPPAGNVPAGSLIIVVYGTGALLLRSAPSSPATAASAGASGRVPSPALSSPFGLPSPRL